MLDTNVPMKRLFRSLCQEYYGSDASVVCNTLYHSTGKTFQQLCAESRLSAKRCAKALHTLLSHCCVKQTSHAIPASSHVNVYHLNTRRLLHVERAASYLQHIRKIFGGRAERITFCFFICGSLTLSELEKLLHPGKISERHRKQLRKTLVTLYTCGIIELPVRNETKLLGNCSAIPEEVCSTAQLEETFNHAFISLNSDGINKKMKGKRANVNDIMKELRKMNVKLTEQKTEKKGGRKTRRKKRKRRKKTKKRRRQKGGHNEDDLTGLSPV